MKFQTILSLIITINKMHSTTYVNLTGGAIMNILDCIKTPVVKSVYSDTRFKIARECTKCTYPVSDRLLCITADLPALNVRQYDPCFHVKIEWEILKIYDYNPSNRQVYQILLDDKELSSIQSKLKTLKSCIDNTCKI